MDDGGKVTSAEQDAWTELAIAIRGQLAKQVELIPAMKPDEAKTLVDSAREAFWLHQNAALWDKELELKESRLFAD